MKIDKLVRGTRIITDAKERRKQLNKLITPVELTGFNEITLPSIQLSDIYTDKAGKEVLNQMYTFKDKGDRDLCLPPEGTAIIQLIADRHYKQQKDVKFWYFQPFYRYERPQEGRYREFWQFGVEWINPRDPEVAKNTLIELSEYLTSLFTDEYEVNDSVKRGLSYYTEDGWEIECEQLGAQKQVCGGGAYKQGIGFALGFDRLMLTLK